MAIGAASDGSSSGFRGCPSGPLEKSHKGRNAEIRGVLIHELLRRTKPMPGVDAAAQDHTVVVVHGLDVFQGLNAGVDPGPNQLLADRCRDLEGGAVF